MDMTVSGKISLLRREGREVSEAIRNASFLIRLRLANCDSREGPAPVINTFLTGLIARADFSALGRLNKLFINHFFPKLT
ncbi:hypothetical protein ES705_49384 [subsurface metagenome]